MYIGCGDANRRGTPINHANNSESFLKPAEAEDPRSFNVTKGCNSLPRDPASSKKLARYDPLLSTAYFSPVEEQQLTDRD